MLLPSKESQIVEFKESTNLWKEGAKSIVAFANTDGGTLYFGIKDNGEILKNNDFNDSSLKSLAVNFKQTIDPNVYFKVNIIDLENTKVIEIIVEKSLKPTHTYGEILYRN